MIVERSGTPVAAIISAEDFDRLTRSEAERQEHLRALDATRAAFKDVPDEELESEVNRALQDARRKRRLHPHS